MRDVWYKTSFLLDQKQTANNLAQERFDNYKKQPLTYQFPTNFSGKLPKNTNTSKPHVQKQRLFVKRDLTPNVKWQMPCI